MTSNIFVRSTLAAALALALAACGGGDGKSAAGGAKGAPQGQEMPPPTVGVVTVEPQTVTLSTDLPARLEAYRTAEVRAQVGGIIQRRLFQEGAFVRAGQPLFQVDASTYEASLHSARASLLSAEANLAKAEADLARYKPLVEADAISKQEYDAAVTARRAAVAQVEAARASIKSAQISMNRSRITAPIAGIIGAAKVSEGTLVAAGDPTVLATIQQNHPMYINITQSALDVMKLRQQYAEGKVQAVGKGGMAVDILLEDGTVYPYKGRLIFADMTVDSATGQVKVRAEVPNPDNVLIPNLYVRVRMPQADIANAFVVPQQAVTRGQQDTVMVVNPDGTMAPRTVTVASQQGSSWVITEGLQPGDKVVVDGTMIAGMMGAKKVTPQEWTPPEAQGAAPAMPSENGASAAQAQEAGIQTASEPQAASEAQTSEAK
ncbi:MAG: efflux RND transporter periplasmic adaptor subunit [Neisseria sp.]|nr:efflux RND transporter periplasmic adaptor subunit [Neisseria sp.]